MEILIDSRWDGDSGIGRVYREVIKHTPSNINISKVNKSFSLGSPLSPLYLAWQIVNQPANVFWSPSFMPPLYSKIPYIITVHDLMHLYYYSKFHAYYMRYVLAPLFKKSQIITVSEFTKQLLITELGLSGDSINLVYNGVDNSFFTNKDIYILNRPYIVYVGNRRAYKNIERMIVAFSRANISKDMVFALSGKSSPELDKIISKNNVEGRVCFLGYIDEEKLPSIYKGASALFYMSLMEGFGLPIIEAMASGTPVITSNTSSMVEISNRAAAICNPLNVREMTEQLELVLNNPRYKSELQIKGLENAKRFTWDKTAKQTWEIITSMPISA
ncbi:MAG: glycosyltransferase family 4 protein [Cyclobacteriaceae bacterium]|nr:glycosyltransferase family 4 protein [Cyclobacteriaceae bacterium]